MYVVFGLREGDTTAVANGVVVAAAAFKEEGVPLVCFCCSGTVEVF